ncbi:geranylgeranylglyceryl/heptaprenylglyceryl phosphate synthase [Flavobacterium sp.]
MLYSQILLAKKENRKLLAILLDPDKLTVEQLSSFSNKIKNSPATHVFIGGSSFEGTHLDELILHLKKHISLPILLFPGNPSQISATADGILFLMLLSGRNADYLIEHQINAVPILAKTKLEIISTGYILIESGSETAVQRVSKTKPLARDNSDYAAQTAKAGEYLGNKLMYLEAGSGAKNVVPVAMIKKVAQTLTIPLLVGGGIRSKQEIKDAFDNGADLVVIGTAFENDITFFE